jgi:menaquinone-dependent protoporphyrinogen oxidase
VDGLEAADAIVLGSPIYGGRWLGPARKVLSEHAEELAARPLWLISVWDRSTIRPSPSSPSPGAGGAATANGRGSTASAAAGSTAMFSTGASALTVRAVGAPDGDFRDWDEIRAWARAITDALAGPAA